MEAMTWFYETAKDIRFRFIYNTRSKALYHRIIISVDPEEAE